MGYIAGVLKEAGEPVLLGCGKEGCEHNHVTYPVQEVVIIPERMTLEEAEAFDGGDGILDKMKADGRMKTSDLYAYPTLLGIWWEAVCDN